MIQANCRSSFTTEDYTFIIETLAQDQRNEEALTQLLADEEMRDQILDHELLFETIFQQHGFARISLDLYFYILTRRVLMEYKIKERGIADYIASMLAEFSRTSRAFSPSHTYPKEYRYLVDMLSDFMDASSWEAFLIRSHLGNYSLFMTGLFPDYINRKATYGRGAPGFEYYEKMGSASYLWASQNKFAEEYRLVEILSSLAGQFRRVRIALNKMADEFIQLDDNQENLDKVLRRIFFGQINPEN